MDQSGASVYVYAKASGMLARSFTGAKVHELFEVRSLQDLWTLVFGKEVPLVPEVLLARQIEKEAEKRFIADYKMLVGCYDKPATVLLQLLRFYDYRNIKTIGAALCSGEKKLPDIANIGKLSCLDYSAWPNIQNITKNSSLSWYNSVPTWQTQKDFDRRLDIQYTKALWESVNSLPKAERQATADFIKQEIILQNCEWALRLRVYYNMSKEDIIPYLACANLPAHKKDVLAGHAIRILDFPLDDRSAWNSWKYSYLLNPEIESEWKIDPRWFEQAVNLKLNKAAISKFHEQPFSALVLVSWFKIKQHELNMIRTAAEGLRLNVSNSELKEFVGV